MQFSFDDPANKEPIKSLGPDGLSNSFNKDHVHANIKAKSKKNANLLIADALLDQQIVSGIGNKYKSELLFLNKIFPFKKAISFSEHDLNNLIIDIPKVLSYGYKNSGKTRPLLNDEKASWNTTHWVFRRTGKQCWVCCTKILSEKKLTLRSTFWCPQCQPYEL